CAYYGSLWYFDVW
nr:immunoglobulin heavy chain junction region [Mus musculus]MBK4184984.1 immunoglobulin heavy chain junction region [Mus musculus]